jgi:hypothetical protein
MFLFGDTRQVSDVTQLHFPGAMLIQQLEFTGD